MNPIVLQKIAVCSAAAVPLLLSIAFMMVMAPIAVDALKKRDFSLFGATAVSITAILCIGCLGFTGILCIGLQIYSR